MLVVGLNAYRNPKYNLNEALDDSRALRAKLAERASGILSSVELHEVYDADATRAGIVAALEAVQRSAGPNDVFVFYYAGHGVMSGGDELREFSRKFPAQKQLFLLAACQSAGVLDAFGGQADSGNGRVAVNELKAFLEAQVPEVSQTHTGSRQHPASNGFGQNSPLVPVPE